MGNKKVLVGLSGGVDSSVAVYLLKEQGYYVTAFTLKLWEDELYGDTEFINDAKEAAELLGVRHIVINHAARFKAKVIDYFGAEYLKGRTPNPCVACNKLIKFGIIFEDMAKMGYDYVATGHYSKIEYKNGRYLIKKPKDITKDQTYMHYNLTQEQLKHIIFALGEYTKEDIRKIAKEIGLKSADKKDSQEICFVKDKDYALFLEKHLNISTPEGNFIDPMGNVLGRHKGIAHYTIGQRKGLGISAGEKIYVTDINPRSNTVTLSDHDMLFTKECRVEDTSFIPFDALDKPVRCNIKIRYGKNEAPGLISPTGSKGAHIVFDEPQRAITPGQSAVFYDEDILVGGGIIC